MAAISRATVKRPPAAKVEPERRMRPIISGLLCERSRQSQRILFPTLFAGAKDGRARVNPSTIDRSAGESLLTRCVCILSRLGSSAAAQWGKRCSNGFLCESTKAEWAPRWAPAALGAAHLLSSANSDTPRLRRASNNASVTPFNGGRNDFCGVPPPNTRFYRFIAT